MDEEYREAVNSFYRLYRALQKTNHLIMNSRFSLYDDGIIEIWEKKGTEKNCICKVQEKDDIACYKKAIGVLKMHYWKEEALEHEKKAG